MVDGVIGRSFLNAAKYVDQGSNAKEKSVTILHLLEVICVLVMTLMDVWRMSLKNRVMKDLVKVK